MRSSSNVETLPTIFITSLVSTHWRKSPKKRSRSSWINWMMALNSSRSESALTACWIVGFGSGVMLFHWFASPAFPFAARQVVWTIRIRLPITLNLCRPCAIGVALGCAWTNTITSICRLASLPKLHGSLASGSGIGDYFCESLFHYGSIRYSHSKARMAGGSISE